MNPNCEVSLTILSTSGQKRYKRVIVYKLDTTQCRITERVINNILETMWKEVVMAYIKASQPMPRGTEGNYENSQSGIVCDLDKIQTRQIPVHIRNVTASNNTLERHLFV